MTADPNYDILAHTYDQAQPDEFGPSVGFNDRPGVPCLKTSPSEYMGFFTTLAGVNLSSGGSQPKYEALTSFAWNTTFDGRSTGSANGLSSIDVGGPVVDGTGGIFNVVDVPIEDMPVDVKQVLAQQG